MFLLTLCRVSYCGTNDTISNKLRSKFLNFQFHYMPHINGLVFNGKPNCRFESTFNQPLKKKSFLLAGVSYSQWSNKQTASYESWKETYQVYLKNIGILGGIGYRLNREKLDFSFSSFVEIYYSSFSIPELEKNPLVYYQELFPSHAPTAPYYPYYPNEHKVLNKINRAFYIDLTLTYKINKKTDIILANKFSHYARYFELSGKKIDKNRSDAKAKEGFILYNTYKTFGNPFMGHYIAYFPSLGVRFRLD